jgi:MoaA/NifB/PqqE/SkfB family radical SAM enzyme
MIVVRKIINFTSSFLHAPLHTLACTWRKYLYKVWLPARIELLRRLVREKPLILQIETINVCNAACIFCAYPSMKRKKGVMELTLFNKIVKDYAAMGGGAVSFTPVVGDALLDPHLIERLKLLEGFPAIDQITLTTNGIALDRYSDDEVRYLLKELFCITVSIGGLDRTTYNSQYGVDCFLETQQAMNRLIELRKGVENPANLIFAFRTDDWKFTRRFKKELSSYQRQGVYISHIWSYDNYSGVVSNDAHPQLTIKENPVNKRQTCVYPSLHMAVCWDGRITACGCVDFEGDKLPIGHAGDNSLDEIWSGKKHTGILDSFAKGALAPVCRKCSLYTPDSILVQPYFKEVRPLTLQFFQEFWGG